MIGGVFLSWLFSFFNAVFSGVTGKVVESIVDLAREVVREIEGDPNLLTSTDKRQAAFNRIKAKALEEGHEVSTHAVNLAIELAVAELRN
jgi:hypothetical protein